MQRWIIVLLVWHPKPHIAKKYNPYSIYCKTILIYNISMAQYGWCRSMHWGANTVKSRSSPKACLIEEQWVNWEWETDNIQSHAKAPGHGLKSHPTLVWWPGILISGGERFPGTCCIQNWNQTVNPIVVWPHARALRSAGNGLRKMGHPPIHKDPQRVKFPWTVVPKIFWYQFEFKFQIQIENQILSKTLENSCFFDWVVIPEEELRAERFADAAACVAWWAHSFAWQCQSLFNI